MANNQQIAEQVLAAVGGKANVSSVDPLHDPAALCACGREQSSGR